ncbi:hypothetical protein [Tenacibaculum sp.]|uniref:hypothetical protein n=1 Tax=Tenacibaculum sp. TaxID=1906242 RepID=UPI003D0A8C11
MSKRLPYYQSEPAEYLAGDIMFCSYAAQGVFTIIRALYWQRDCELTLSQVKKRCKGADDLIQELIDEKIIKVSGDTISISFLDEQFEKAVETSENNSLAGKKSAKLKKIRKEINERLLFISEKTNEPLEELQRKYNVNSTSVSFLLQQNSTIKIREDKIREDKEEESDDAELVETTEKIKQIETVYEEFVAEVKNGYHHQWAEATYMRLKIKKGSLANLITDFKNQLIIDLKVHPNTHKLKDHLNNWLNKQNSLGNLNQYKLQKQGAL